MNKKATEIFRHLYYQKYIPYRINRIRKQEKIKVAFHLINLGVWKTEELYRLMLKHPRFEPYLIISKNTEEDDRENIIHYCRQKGYSFHEIDFPNQRIWDVCYPDIAFYQKQYDDTLSLIHI